MISLILSFLMDISSQLKKAYLKKAGISIKSNKISEIIKIRGIIVQIDRRRRSATPFLIKS